MTRRLAILALLLGGGLLAVMLHQADLRTTWAYLALMGWWGLAVVVAVSLVGLAFEAASWLLTLEAASPTLRWWSRVSRVLVVGSAIELLTPLAALGGDSAKAILLKRRYGVSLRDASASLVLSRTSDLASLIAFIGVGLLLMTRADQLPEGFQTSAAAALAILVVLGILFIVAQRQRPMAWIKRRVTVKGIARNHRHKRLAAVLEALKDVEDRLAAFYAKHPRRFALSAAASFVEWTSGAYISYMALGLFETPVTFAEAIVIESIVLLVRSALFFVPVNLGTQDGAIVVMCAAIAGSSSAGLALAAARRARDLLVIAVGLAMGVSSWSIARELLPSWVDTRR